VTLFHVGGAQVRLHTGLIFVFAGAWIGGLLGPFLLGALALALHEYCHALVAHALGYRVASVELLPFGGVARLAGGAISPGSEFIIALAGPVCSMVIASACGMMLPALPTESPALLQFMRLNLLLAFFNLLPGLPLDGGRMLRALLLRFLRPAPAAKIAAWCGVALGAAMLGGWALLLRDGGFYPAPAVLGLFLLLGAAREVKLAAGAPLGAMLRRQDAFARGRSLPVRHMAAAPGLRAADALAALSAGRYTVLRVVGPDMRTRGELDEGALLAGVARWGADVTVGRILDKN